LHDRSSRPHRLRQPTSQAIVEEIERLRRQRWTGKQITAKAGVRQPSADTLKAEICRRRRENA
jgi:hypothetical protein